MRGFPLVTGKGGKSIRNVTDFENLQLLCCRVVLYRINLQTRNALLSYKTYRDRLNQLCRIKALSP